MTPERNEIMLELLEHLSKEKRAAFIAKLSDDDTVEILEALHKPDKPKSAKPRDDIEFAMRMHIHQSDCSEVGCHVEYLPDAGPCGHPLGRLTCAYHCCEFLISEIVDKLEKSGSAAWWRDNGRGEWNDCRDIRDCFEMAAEVMFYVMKDGLKGKKDSGKEVLEPLDEFYEELVKEILKENK